jgi:hypothetical protein
MLISTVAIAVLQPSDAALGYCSIAIQSKLSKLIQHIRTSSILASSVDDNWRIHPEWTTLLWIARSASPIWIATRVSNSATGIDRLIWRTATILATAIDDTSRWKL